VDPLAEKYASWSSYNYVVGNPLSYIDPDGRSPNNGNDPPIELFPQLLIQTVNRGIQHVKYSIWRNWTIATTDKTEEDIPYRTYDTAVNGAGTVEVVYTEHDVEPPIMERLADTGKAGLDMAAGLPSSGPASLMAKLPGGGGTISEVVSKVAEGFDNLKCVECANAISNMLKKEGISGEIIQYHPTFNGKKVATPVHSDKAKKGISDSGVHQGVLVDGKVYDNIHTKGTDMDSWLKDKNHRGNGHIVETIKTF